MSHASNHIILSRDCESIRIPSGEACQISSGTEVFLTQALGGSFTVRTDQGLFRIADKDADALGQKPQSSSADAMAADLDPDAYSESQLWAALRLCFDPEIPVNIVDLGLVYDLQDTELEPGEHRVEVKMTLTAPGCGMGPAIANDAREKLLALGGVREASVEIVWDPPWHQSMITPEGRKILGL